MRINELLLEVNTALIKNAQQVASVSPKSIPAYHGTVKAHRGDLIFDKKKIHPKDQFLGEGFYFTLDKNIAVEYANIRSIKLGEMLPRSHPANTGGETFFYTPDKRHIVSTGSVMRGEDIEGNPIRQGQELLTADLSGLQKTYFIKGNNASRLNTKNADLAAQGYDSIAFEGFSDRSRQIMVFPEFIDRVKIVSRQDL